MQYGLCKNGELPDLLLVNYRLLNKSIAAELSIKVEPQYFKQVH